MRKVFNSTPEYVNYDVVVNFAGYIGADEFLTVFAKAGATEKEILETIVEDYRDELFEGEVVEFDGDDGYTVEVTFGGFIGASAEYEVYADSEDEAIENAIYDATWALSIDSYEVTE